MFSKTISKRTTQILIRPLLFNGSISKVSKFPLKSLLISLRSYSLNQNAHTTGAKQSISFLNSGNTKSTSNQQRNEELLNNRIYEDARLPKTQEEYDLYEDIFNVIRERILPNIQEDGGDMEFRGFNYEDGLVYVKLTGACTSCSMSETTLKHGIENMLTYFVPEVTGVKQVFDPEEEIAFSEFQKLERNLKNKRT